eukprot:TRINITY_DN63510_c0_g1_i1.p1 TRINITY_DN63510_c0_g1~~TRINITY_DN63510_c0_g1_i1.p1  ORF type:complete len:837 (-),score=153.53 TRINITY_DN63510_c0_g1_i1:348-2858(-)
MRVSKSKDPRTSVKSFVSTAQSYVALRRAAYSESRRLLASERSVQADYNKNKLACVFQCVAKGLHNAKTTNHMVHLVEVEVVEHAEYRKKEQELRRRQEELYVQKQSEELVKELGWTRTFDDVDLESEDSEGLQAEDRSSISKAKLVQDVKRQLANFQPSASSSVHPAGFDKTVAPSEAPAPEMTDSHSAISRPRRSKPEAAASPPSSSGDESGDLPETLREKHNNPDPEPDSAYTPALRRKLVTTADEDARPLRPESTHLPRVARRTLNYGQGRKHRRPPRDLLAGQARPGLLAVQEERHLRELLSELADGCAELSSSAAFGWPSEDLVCLLEICRAMVAELNHLCDEIIQSNRPSTPRSLRAAEGQASELLRLCSKAAKQMAALRCASLSHEWKLSPCVQTAVAELSSKALQGSQAVSHASTFGSFPSRGKVMTRGTAGSQFSSTDSLLGWIRGDLDGSPRRPLQLATLVQKEDEMSLVSAQSVRQTGTSLRLTNEAYDAEAAGAELHASIVDLSTDALPENRKTASTHAVLVTDSSALPGCPQEATQIQTNKAGVLQTPAATTDAPRPAERGLAVSTPRGLSAKPAASDKSILLATFSKGALLALEEESSPASKSAAKTIEEIKHVQQLLRRQRSLEEASMAMFTKEERCEPGEADPQLSIHGTIDNRCLLASRMRRTALAVTNLIAVLVQLPEALASTAQSQTKTGQAGVVAPFPARGMLGSTVQTRMEAGQAGGVAPFSARVVRTKEQDLALELPVVAPFSARGIQAKDRNFALELPLLQDTNQAVVQSTLPAESGHACSRSALPQLVTGIAKPSAVIPNFRLRRRTPAKG